MATSGSKSIAVTGQHTLTFSWSRISYNVSNNTSTISWTLKLIATNGTIKSSASKAWSVTVNGTKYSGTNTIGMTANTTKTLASGTTTISHNSDGTKTFSYSFSQEIAITYGGTYIGSKSGSGTGTLDTIPRASSITCSTANIESVATISISKVSNSFTHTLTYSFKGLTGTIATKTSNSSVKWTIPTSFYAKIPNATSGTGTISCTTYNGNTTIGTNTCSFTVKTDSSKCKPTLSPIVSDTNETTTALTGSDNKLVKYYSEASYAIGADAKNSASVKSQSVVCGGVKKTTSPDSFSNVTSNSFKFTVTDSRGYTTTETITLEMIDYIKLTCNLTATATLESNNTTTISFGISGKYFNGSFGRSNNSLTVQYRYKSESDNYSNWINVSSGNTSGNTYSYNGSITGLDYLKAYTVEARVIDALATKNSNSKTVKSIPIFDWGENDFNFNVPVKISRNQADGEAWYQTDSKIGGGLNLANSDIVGANTIYFNDKSNAVGEGFGFPNGKTNSWDYLKAYDGNVSLIPNYPTNTTEVKLLYGVGDTLDVIKNTPLSGFITNGKKTIHISIPLNKPLSPEVTGYTISGKLQGRHIGGYLYNPATSSATYTLSNAANEGFSYTTSLSGSLLYLYITFNTPITDATNNTPLCVVPDGTITITFQGD